MTDTTIDHGKKHPDVIAFTSASQGKARRPQWTRIGVGFTLKNGGKRLRRAQLRRPGAPLEKPASSYRPPALKPAW